MIKLQKGNKDDAEMIRKSSGLGEITGEAVYDDGANKAMVQNRDRQGFENASSLFQRVNASAVREGEEKKGEGNGVVFQQLKVLSVEAR